jgi:hypothetical protein
MSKGLVKMPDSTRRPHQKSKSKTTPRGRGMSFESCRRQLDEQRKRRRLEMQWAHFWNLCPKCGGDMFEQRSPGFYFDVCRDCHSILIEQAELELALEHQEPAKFLKAILSKSKKPKID